MKPDVLDSEIFPPNFIVAYRRDRILPTGGGVFAAVSNNFLLERLEDLESDTAEMLWIRSALLVLKISTCAHITDQM